MQKVVITGICTAELPKLNASEAETMLLDIKNGRTDLRETFLMSNARLVLSMVQRFKNAKENADDLFQVGMVGLIKALDNFDVRFKVKFSTYAVPMVLGEMKRFIREGTALKVGRHQRDVAYRAIQARERLERQSVREASLMEIAEEIDVPYKEVVSALDAIAEPVSIYEQVYGEPGDGLELIDLISEQKTEEDKVNLHILREGLEKLKDKERNIIDMRYYKGMTQTEIADELQISQAQVSRLEKNAIGELKANF